MADDEKLLILPAELGQSELTTHERKRVREAQALNAHMVYEAIKREGEDEVARPAIDLAYSGLAAGLSMGFSFAAEALLRSHLPDAPWRPLITKLGYPVGFLIVILGRQQLFTENTLTPVIPLLDKKSPVKLPAVLTLWGAVFAANVVGAVLFALVSARTAAFDPEFRLAMHAASIESYQQGLFGVLLLKAVFAGWLIALVVWLMPAADNARFWVIVTLTYIIGIAHFPHIIAGAVTVSYGVWDGSLPAGAVLARWLVPTLIGNMIGGILLVAALNYAQVAASDDEK